MNSHSRARTTPLSRAQLVERVQALGWTVAEAADKASISVRTGYKWVARAKREGRDGLQDRSSAPGRMPRRTDPDRTAVIVIMRHSRMSSPAIARVLRMPRSTVARVLEREALGRFRPSRAP